MHERTSFSHTEIYDDDDNDYDDVNDYIITAANKVIPHLCLCVC